MLPDLCQRTAQIFCADTASLADTSLWHEYRSWLDEAEQARLASFRRSADQVMFLLGRATLRYVLARLTGRSPRTVELRIDQQGKPFCPSLSTPAFNLSHADGHVVLALAHAAAVGVDIEAIDRDYDWPLVAKDHFAPDELAEVQSLPISEQSARFFRYWTLKEAWGKATGTGIVVDLRRLTFAATGEDRYRRWPTPLEDDPSREFLWAKQISERHTLALAVVDSAVQSSERWRILPGRSLTRTPDQATPFPGSL